MRLKPCRLAGFSLLKSFWLPSHFGWNVLQFCVSKKVENYETLTFVLFFVASFEAEKNPFV